MGVSDFWETPNFILLPSEPRDTRVEVNLVDVNVLLRLTQTLYDKCRQPATSAFPVRFTKRRIRAVRMSVFKLSLITWKVNLFEDVYLHTSRVRHPLRYSYNGVDHSPLMCEDGIIHNIHLMY